MRLNICSGPIWLPGYLNVDIDPPEELLERARNAGLTAPSDAGEAYYVQRDLLLPWPWKADTATEILADNCLEHFDHAGLDHLLREAWRVLQPGAAMTGRVPDIETIVHYATERADWSWEPSWALQGPYQTTAYNALHNMAFAWGHLQVFTRAMLQERLTLAGFEAAVEPHATHALRYSARKPAEG